MAGALCSAAALTACGEGGSSGTKAPPTAAAGVGCAPIADEALVLLSDDKNLQNSDNIISVVNKKASTPALISAVDKVNASLDQPKLLALNKAVDVDRKTPQVAAQEYAAANNIATGLSGGSGKVVVGAAGFAESQVLAELYRIALVGAGFDASVLQSTNREVYEPALERGEITVFPEYAATLTEFLNKKANGDTATVLASGDITKTVDALKPLADKVGLAVGAPSKASDQNAFAVSKAVADKYQLKTLSDFAAKCTGAASILTGPPECPDRAFCQPGLEKTYGIEFGDFFQSDAGGPQSKTALKTGKATLGLVLSSDSSLTAA